MLLDEIGNCAQTTFEQLKFPRRDRANSAVAICAQNERIGLGPGQLPMVLLGGQQIGDRDLKPLAEQQGNGCGF